jgi:hypothetical protein
MKNITYELHKKTYALSRDKKEYLFNKMDELLKNISSTETENIVKTASGAHDPETKEDMLLIIENLGKFIDIDTNMDLKNLSIFLHPLLVGSKKFVLRKYRLIGLIKHLYKICKLTKETKARKKRERYLIEFKKTIKEIIERLNISEEEEINKNNRSVVTRKHEKKLAVLNFDKNIDSCYDDTVIATNFLDNLDKFITANNLSINEALELLPENNFSFKNKTAIINGLKKISS